MKTVVIDARESGTSTGRYIDKLVEYLHKLKPEHKIVLLTKPHRVEFYKRVAPSFEVVETQYNEFGFGEQLGFLRQIKSLRPDLVHFGMVQQPILYRGNVVTTMHDLTTVRFKNPSKNPVVFTIKQTVYKWVNKLVARKSNTIITPTQFVKDDIVQYAGVNPDKVAVTWESADKIAEIAEPIPKLHNKKFIMYTGRPTPHKNLSRLIDAFTILAKDHPDLYLVLVGKRDPLYEAHERMVKEKGINNVIFTGFVKEGELRWLYENTACYVVPSMSEGFGLPGLEAMAHGAPVASSDATCLPEVYGDAAAYFSPFDIHAMAVVIDKILTDRSFSNKLRTLGEKRLNLFSWKKMAKQTFSVYQEVLGQR